MNKLFFIFLLFTSFSYADLDLGEDFVAGEVISAEEFNNKFGKLKMVLGEVKDADLLGSWDCTSYKITDPWVDIGHVDDYNRINKVFSLRNKLKDVCNK